VEDFRVASRQSWSTVAPDWGELTALVDRQLGVAADWMIEAAALEPGERVLELAGGPGTLSLIAARAVGPEGQVTCTDFAEPMVDVARSRMAAEGAANVECRVMDAEAIDLRDGAVDVVLCRMGYMLMADPPAALHETARVLKPGGRLALAVWTGATANPWAALPMRAAMDHVGAPPPPPDAPGLWALADPERLGGMLQEAGLEPVRIERLDDTVLYESVEQWFEQTSRLAGPLRALLANLDGDARASIVQRMSDAASSYRQTGGSLSMPEQMLAAQAQRKQ
jgi:SAM-dependent methyltransferase